MRRLSACAVGEKTESGVGEKIESEISPRGELCQTAYAQSDITGAIMAPLTHGPTIHITEEPWHPYPMAL